MSDFYDEHEDIFGLNEPEPDEDEEFQLVDIIGIDRVLGRIRKLRNRHSEVSNFSREKIKNTKEWASKEQGKLEEKIGNLESQIFRFLKQKEELGEETSIRVEEGTVFLKSSNPSVVWDDENKILEYFKESGNEDFIKTKYSIDKNKIKDVFSIDENTGKLVNENGEVLEGAHVEKKDDQVVVRFNDKSNG